MKVMPGVLDYRCYPSPVLETVAGKTQSEAVWLRAEVLAWASLPRKKRGQHPGGICVSASCAFWLLQRSCHRDYGGGFHTVP